jgi:hypothetical protein
MYLANKLSEITPVTARIYWDPAHATHQSIREYMDGDAHNFQIQFPDLTEPYEFSAIVTGFEPDDAPADDGMLEADITLQPDGVSFVVPEA